MQKSLTSAKQIWFQRAPRGIPQCPKQAQRPRSGKQLTASPASGMWDSHCAATGIGQGHQGENIQEEIRAAVWFLKGACTCSLPQCVTPSAASYPEMLPLLNSQFPGKSSVSNLPPHQHLFISTTQLLLTVFICISPLSALLMLNEAQDRARCDAALSGAGLGSRGAPARSVFQTDIQKQLLSLSPLQQSSGGCFPEKFPSDGHEDSCSFREADLGLMERDRLNI